MSVNTDIYMESFVAFLLANPKGTVIIDTMTPRYGYWTEGKVTINGNEEAGEALAFYREGQEFEINEVLNHYFMRDRPIGTRYFSVVDSNPGRFGGIWIKTAADDISFAFDSGIFVHCWIRVA